MAGGAIFAFAGASLIASLSGASELRVASGDVHIADVAEVRGPGAKWIGQIMIAQLPEGARKTLSRRQISELIERAVPAIQVSGHLDGNVVIASIAVPAPRAMPRPYVAEARVVERGQALTLNSAAGAVVIQRPVIALQSATAKDMRVFVRTNDGTVLSAPLAKGAAK